MTDGTPRRITFEGSKGITEVKPRARSDVARESMRQVIKVSPALLGWIQRAPSKRVSVHRDRWNAEPIAPTDVAPTDDGDDQEGAGGGA